MGVRTFGSWLAEQSLRMDPDGVHYDPIGEFAMDWISKEIVPTDYTPRNFASLEARYREHYPNVSEDLVDLLREAWNEWAETRRSRVELGVVTFGEWLRRSEHPEWAELVPEDPTTTDDLGVGMSHPIDSEWMSYRFRMLELGANPFASWFSQDHVRDTDPRIDELLAEEWVLFHRFETLEEMAERNGDKWVIVEELVDFLYHEWAREYTEQAMEYQSTPDYDHPLAVIPAGTLVSVEDGRYLGTVYKHDGDYFNALEGEYQLTGPFSDFQAAMQDLTARSKTAPTVLPSTVAQVRRDTRYRVTYGA